VAVAADAAGERFEVEFRVPDGSWQRQPLPSWLERDLMLMDFDPEVTAAAQPFRLLAGRGWPLPASRAGLLRPSA